MAEATLLAEYNAARGLWTGNPLQMPAGVLTDARNVEYRDGRLCKRRGYTMVLADGVGTELVRFAHDWQAPDGTTRMIGVTASNIWSFDGAAFADHGNMPAGDEPLIDCCTWGSGMAYLTKHALSFQKWDGGAGDFANVGATYLAAPLLPTFIRPFGSSMIGANVNLGGGQYPQRVHWSVVRDPDDWEVVPGGGWANFPQLRGDITGLEYVGRGLAIFAEESIGVLKVMGTVLVPYYFEAGETTVGTRSPHSIRHLGPPFSGHLAFLGSDYNIHTFDGLTVVPRGDAIHSLLKSLLELDHLVKAWATVMPEEGIYRLAVTTSGATENNLIIDWHYRRGQFYIHELAGGVGAWSAAARYVKAAAPTWAELDTATTTWEQLEPTWAELIQESGWWRLAFVGASGDLIAPDEGRNDNGTAISAHALFAPTQVAKQQQVAEADYVEILCDRSSVGSTLDVGLGGSGDGANFTWESHSHSLEETLQPFVNVRSQGRWFALRVANNEVDGTFALRGWRLWGKPQVGVKV